MRIKNYVFARFWLPQSDRNDLAFYTKIFLELSSQYDIDFFSTASRRHYKICLIRNRVLSKYIIILSKVIVQVTTTTIIASSATRILSDTYVLETLPVCETAKKYIQGVAKK